MHKSTNSNLASDCSQLVSRLDVGRRVTVNGHFGVYSSTWAKWWAERAFTVEWSWTSRLENTMAPIKMWPILSVEEEGNLDKPVYANHHNPSNNRRPNKLISKSAIPL
uniref:Uncharacterized protein n=1 Tax=Ditylenchus dipsaci TaxID=166011 RepID=A0A915DSB3_9BILA